MMLPYALPFDPIAHAAAIRADPSAFVKMASIAADAMALGEVRRAKSEDDLRRAFQAHARVARAAGDTELVAILTAGKDARKVELK